MKFEIVELDEFSGIKASIYSIYISDASETLFDEFIGENEIQFSNELGSITDRLELGTWKLIMYHLKRHFFAHTAHNFN